MDANQRRFFENVRELISRVLAEMDRLSASVFVKPAYWSALGGLALSIFVQGCGGGGGRVDFELDNDGEFVPVDTEFVVGADLSYVNQMEDCGATYYEDSTPKDPYLIMADAGMQVVRVRLWHDPLAHPPFPNSYSNLDDVEETIRRAKEAGMAVMLNFHYSDQWADPGKQWIPDAWKNLAGDDFALESAIYEYSSSVIERLQSEGLIPEYIQIGNETNGNVVVPYGQSNELYPTDFSRQAKLLQAGVNGVKDAISSSSSMPKIILHVAGPQNLWWWFSNINLYDIEYDLVGVSFYDEYTDFSIDELGALIELLTSEFGKKVMVVETALAWTSTNNDGASNIHSSMPDGYGSPSPANQLSWLLDLRNELMLSGAAGMVYWEPAWVSTNCAIEWGVGSNMENAGFFNFDNNLIEDGAVRFLDYNISK